MPTSKKVELLRERLKSPLTLLAFDVAFSGNNKIDSICNIRTGKEIRFRFWLSEDKAGKEAKRRPTRW